MARESTLSQEKAELRARLKAVRGAIPESARRENAERIAARLFDLEDVAAAHTFFVYISYASEVGTHDIIRRLLDEGKVVTVPKIINAERMLAHRFDHWEQLKPGALGILTPTDGETYRGPFDVAVTPGLGFTVKGHRIGFGAGYYDRWFASHQVRRKVALAYEAQIIERLPTDEYDIPVDMIITEKRLIRIG